MACKKAKAKSKSIGILCIVNISLEQTDPKSHNYLKPQTIPSQELTVVERRKQLIQIVPATFSYIHSQILLGQSQPF